MVLNIMQYPNENPTTNIEVKDDILKQSVLIMFNTTNRYSIHNIAITANGEINVANICRPVHLKSDCRKSTKTPPIIAQHTNKITPSCICFCISSNPNL